MSSTAPVTADSICTGEALCFDCRRSLPRTAMRWGLRASGPVWNPTTVRVYRCGDCLSDEASADGASA